MSDWLKYRSTISSHSPALIFKQQIWSYADMEAKVAEVTDGLIGNGVKPGSHVAALLPNQPGYIFLIHALVRLGAVLIPLNTRLTQPELQAQIKQAEAGFMICSQDASDYCKALSIDVIILTISEFGDLSGEGMHGSLDELNDHTFHAVNLEQIQAIMFTSGTTGTPKGAAISLSNHFWSATASSYRLGLDLNDRWMLTLPIYHIGGMAIIFRACLYGIPIILEQRFEPENILERIGQYKATILSAVPTMLGRLIRFPNAGLLAQLGWFLLGGAQTSSDLLMEAKKRSLSIALTYGLTEASSQVATSVGEQVFVKPGCVGKPLMFLEIKIGSPVSGYGDDKTIGEILVKGPTVFNGYYNQLDESSSVVREGWLHTGDLGYLDDDGDLWVVQRRTDLIISGGENIYPAEVEKIIKNYPGVDEVCVIGIEDPEWGQFPVAIVSTKHSGIDEKTLIEYAKEQLAGYKVPIRILIVQGLPKTASGKINRNESHVIAKQLLEILN